MAVDKPKLIVIAGPNGSGKTTLTSQILEHDWKEGCHFINPDNIANELFGDWNSEEAVRKAVRYAEDLREQYLEKRESLLFETVLSVDDKIDYIRRAKEAGYFVRLFFVGTSHPSINASRVLRRVMEGGHDVPIPKIIKRYGKSIANCSIVAQMVDRAYVYDNSAENAPPKLLFRLKDGKLERSYGEIGDWAKPILPTTP